MLARFFIIPFVLTTNIARLILSVQSLFYLLTALWALVDLETFMEVTGKKTDTWLVSAMGLMLVSISITFFLSVIRNEISLPIRFLALSIALVLAGVDFWYVYNETISTVYMLDGFLELGFSAAWILILLRKKKKNQGDAVR